MPKKEYKPREYWPERFKQLGPKYVGHLGQTDNEVGEQIQVFWRQLEPFIPQDTSELLDFGCGVGRLAPLASQRVRRYVGVDITREAIEHAPRGERIEYHHLTEDRLPFADRSFALVCSLAVIQHIVADDHYRLWCRELARVIKPDGRFLIIDWNEPPRPFWKRRAKHVIGRTPEQIAGALNAVIERCAVFDAEDPKSHYRFVARPRS
jgi:SAM-dependent methyltransferase